MTCKVGERLVKVNEQLSAQQAHPGSRQRQVEGTTNSPLASCSRCRALHKLIRIREGLSAHHTDPDAQLMTLGFNLNIWKEALMIKQRATLFFGACPVDLKYASQSAQGGLHAGRLLTVMLWTGR